MKSRSSGWWKSRSFSEVEGPQDVSYEAANVDWRKYAGQEINVLGVNGFVTQWQQGLLPEFEQITGIKVNYELLGRNPAV